MYLLCEGILQGGCLPAGPHKATGDVFRALSGPDLAPSRFFADCCGLEEVNESSILKERFLPPCFLFYSNHQPKRGDEQRKDFSSPLCSALGDLEAQGRRLTPSPLCPPSQAVPG